jgi:Coenzyme PQQ synthesis protein D (PqqD)
MNIAQDFLNKIFKKQPDIVFREIAGELLLVPVRGNLADMQRIFMLNSVGEYIWRNLDGIKNLSEICGGVLESFEIQKNQANSDLVEFIHELSDQNLIAEVM